MLAVYVICGVVGLGLALVAAFFGDHDHETDTQFEMAVHEFAADHGAAEAELWLPFLSLRFWTYGFAGFGLTGLLLSIYSKAPGATILGLALLMGVLCGLMIAITVRLAQKSQTTSAIGSRDMVGLEANVLVAIRPGQPGKVRFQAKGDIIDMIAVADEGSVLEAGARALVVGIEGDRARVVSLGTFEEENLYARS